LRFSQVVRSRGFAGVADFSRAFREVYGCTPRDAMNSAAAASLRGLPPMSPEADEKIIDWIRQFAG
jgi:AraC-like DNA-binding protein